MVGVRVIDVRSPGVLHLAWDANTEPDLAGYILSYGLQSRSTTEYPRSINVGNVITYTLTGLTAGITYFASVQAYDTSNNVSTFSTEMSGQADLP